MATLAEAVDEAETDWLVSADIPDDEDYLTVESEVVQITATFPAQYQARDGSTSAPRIRVVRAAGGTTAASHADGTTLTPLIPPSASSGGAAGTLAEVLAAGNDADALAIVNLAEPTDQSDAATKSYADGVGAAVEAAVRPVISDTAPDPTAPGMVWVQTFDATGLTPGLSGLKTYPTFVRDDADLAWLPVGSATVDDLGNLRALVQFDPEDGGLNLYTYQADGTRRCSITMDDAGIDTWWRDDDGNIISMLNCNGGVAPAIEAVVQDAVGNPLSAIRVDGTNVSIGFAADAHNILLNASGVTIDTSASVKMPNLPTADPVVAGALWNDAGIVTVSAG